MSISITYIHIQVFVDGCQKAGLYSITFATTGIDHHSSQATIDKFGDLLVVGIHVECGKVGLQFAVEQTEM
jgi:hypothetical protein